MSDQRSLVQANRFFVAAILVALTVWPVAFAIGAYGQVFYSLLLQIWVVSLVALIAGLYIGALGDGRRFLTQKDMLLLALPSLWLLIEVLADAFPSALLHGLRLALTALTGLLALPHIIRILLRATLPQATELDNPRLDRGLIMLTVAVALIGCLAGRYNNLIVTCEDFVIAGDDPPANCWKSQAEFR